MGRDALGVQITDWAAVAAAQALTEVTFLAQAGADGLLGFTISSDQDAAPDSCPRDGRVGRIWGLIRGCRRNMICNIKRGSRNETEGHLVLCCCQMVYVICRQSPRRVCLRANSTAICHE